MVPIVECLVMPLYGKALYSGFPVNLRKVGGAVGKDESGGDSSDVRQ